MRQHKTYCLSAAMLTAMLLLAGCGGLAGSSLVEASTANVPPPTPGQPPANGYSEAASVDLSPSVPQGLVDVTEQDDLIGSWLHRAGPVVDGPEKSVYQFRFNDTQPWTMMLSLGKYSTDDGLFFHGEYELGPDGEITAILRLWELEAEAEDAPSASVVFRAQKPEDKTGMLVFTVLSIVTENEEFLDAFAPLLEVAVAFVGEG